jgi:transposase-like protein
MEKEILEKLIKEEKMSLDQIAKITGIPKSTVAWYVKKFGLSPAKKYYPLPEDRLKVLYLNKKLSAQEIAKELGVWEKSVFFWLKKYCISVRPRGTNQHSHVPKVEKVKPLKKSRKVKVEDVIALVQSRECKFLDLVYVNQRVRLFYTCHCGYDHSTFLSNFKKGYSCAECKRQALKGEKNHNYNPNLTDEERLELGRYEEGYKSWRSKVFKKYGFSCDICSSKESGKLNAHHLNSYRDHPTMRTSIENGVCLCENCHTHFHREYGFGNNTEQQYQTFRKRYVSQNLRP